MAPTSQESLDSINKNLLRILNDDMNSLRIAPRLYEADSRTRRTPMRLGERMRKLENTPDSLSNLPAFSNVLSSVTALERAFADLSEEVAATLEADLKKTQFLLRQLPFSRSSEIGPTRYQIRLQNDLEAQAAELHQEKPKPSYETKYKGQGNRVNLGNFTKLPQEIRDLIWKESLPGPRVVVVNLISTPEGWASMSELVQKLRFASPTPIPMILHVDQEARMEALRCVKQPRADSPQVNHYVTAFASKDSKGAIYVDFARDIIYPGGWLFQPEFTGPRLSHGDLLHCEKNGDCKKIQKLIMAKNEVIFHFTSPHGRGFRFLGLKELFVVHDRPHRSTGIPEWCSQEEYDWEEGPDSGCGRNMLERQGFEAGVMRSAMLLCPPSWVPPKMRFGRLVRRPL